MKCRNLKVASALVVGMSKVEALYENGRFVLVSDGVMAAELTYRVEDGL